MADLEYKRVYVAHPFGNNVDNEFAIKHIIRELQKVHPNATFYNGITTFGFLYNDVDYHRGMEMCLDLLDYCDALYVFGNYESSKGCRMEIEHFLKQDKPIHIIHSIDIYNLILSNTEQYRKSPYAQVSKQ